MSEHECSEKRAIRWVRTFDAYAILRWARISRIDLPEGASRSRVGEATIDLIRHRPTAPHGSMDYLMVELLLGLRHEGFRLFNLGMTPLAGVGDRPGVGLQERAIHQLFEHLNRFFSYKGLLHYKAKFDPAWEERFLVYEGGPAGLIRTVLALTRVTEG
jgi:phosphatidylglycerol lysyltransferase